MRNMWSRANMASTMSLLFLLGCLCVIVQAKGSKVEVKATVDAILEKASTWLWSQRDNNAGWANDTNRVILALRLGNLSRDNNTPPPISLEMQLSSKQMELEIVLLLWRHREIGRSQISLARYALALNSLCIDPRKFYGHDLIGTLQHHEPPTDYESAFTTLASCNAQAHVRKRQMRRLLDIAHTAENHNIETVAMVIMMLRCIVQDHRHRNLQHFIRKPSLVLTREQKLDGSFGDLEKTALIMQALEDVENEPVDNWNRTAAIAWLASKQKPDGSFDGDVKSTADVVLGLAARGLSNIRSLDCSQGFVINPPSRAATNIHAIETMRPLNVSSAPSTAAPTLVSTANELSTTTKSLESTTLATATTPQVLANVTYTLWVGSNVDQVYQLSITAPKNEKFFDVMVTAAEKSPNFQFSAYEWPNGHYVHTLAGYKEEPMSYHYWLLYRLPTPPDRTAPPGNQFVAPGGVDDLQINNGEHYLFWYKKL